MHQARSGRRNGRRAPGLGGLLAALLALTACEPAPYGGPPDAGDVEMETQLGEFLFVPVDEIENIEPGDGGTMVWTVEDSFVVRESPATLRERMRQAKRER